MLMGHKTLKAALLCGAVSWLALPSTASAQFRFYRSYDNNCTQCQPAYPGQPGQPMYQTQPIYPAQPGQPAFPSQPSVIPSPKELDIKDKMDKADKKDDTQPQQQPQQQQDQQNQQNFNPETAANPGPVGGMTAYNVGMQGRGDANNRFNLFDNMSAIPQNRVWLGYQHMAGFNTFTNAEVGTPGYGAFANPHHQVNLYRVGMEYMLANNVSIVAQTQYIASAGVVQTNDSWSNPQFALKYAFASTQDCVMSGFVGFQPETGPVGNELVENATRITPGLLFYRNLGPRTFMQGGGQFGISTGNLANTFDYAVSAGYWMYKDCDHFNYYGGCNGCNQCRSACHLVGIIPQIELFGKELINNATNIPWASANSSSAFGMVYNEGRHVYDVTLGVRFLFSQGMGIAVGGSFPLTGAQVRDSEFLSTLSWNF